MFSFRKRLRNHLVRLIDSQLQNESARLHEEIAKLSKDASEERINLKARIDKLELVCTEHPNIVFMG
jgi:hypothetical protein